MTVYDFVKRCMDDPEFNRGGVVANERELLDAVGFDYKVENGSVKECGEDAQQFFSAMCSLAALNRKYADRQIKRPVKVEAMYTGGGIWLGVAPIDEDRHIVVDWSYLDDAPSIFKTKWEYDELADGFFLVWDDETLLRTPKVSEMDNEELAAYGKALAALAKEAY